MPARAHLALALKPLVLSRLQSPGPDSVTYLVLGTLLFS